jgi:competence protein ComEC
MTGLEPPIIRAAIMAGFSFLGEILGQQPWTGWIFLLTALLMVIINPVYLFSLSFQLSFLATAGVLFLTKPLEDRFRRWSLPGFFKASLATTLAAQFMVTPRLMSVFGGLSLVSLVSNTLVLVWVEFLMAVGFGVSWLSLIVPESVARFLFFIPWGGLSFIVWVTRFFSSYHLAYINTPKIAWINFIPWYLMLLWFLKKPSNFV